MLFKAWSCSLRVTHGMGAHNSSDIGSHGQQTASWGRTGDPGNRSASWGPAAAAVATGGSDPEVQRRVSDKSMDRGLACQQVF